MGMGVGAGMGAAMGNMANTNLNQTPGTPPPPHLPPPPPPTGIWTPTSKYRRQLGQHPARSSTGPPSRGSGARRSGFPFRASGRGPRLPLRRPGPRGAGTGGNSSSSTLPPPPRTGSIGSGGTLPPERSPWRSTATSWRGGNRTGRSGFWAPCPGASWSTIGSAPPPPSSHSHSRSHGRRSTHRSPGPARGHRRCRRSRSLP